MDGLVIIHDEGCGIQRVVLNRPECRNALSIELLSALRNAINSLASDRKNRVVILTGAGLVFSAGLDLRQAADETLVEASASGVEHTLRLLRETPLVLIAAVQGGAFAGGAGLMAACDIVVAADDARVGFPEARRGLLPALICEVLKTRVREGDLRDLFLTGDLISAVRACELGLFQRVVPSVDLMEEALRVARSVVAGGPETIRHTKALLNAMLSTPAAADDTDLSQLHLQARRSHEAKEGLNAFLQKRNPEWMTEP